MNRCTRIRIDNGIEYLNESFMDYIAERGIRLEPITAGNPQMNGSAERLNQILMRKANIFLKDNDIAVKWWPELVHAVNHFRNICFVTGLIDSNGKPITSFHALTERPYEYNTLRRIGQKGKYQVSKSSTGYKKLDNHRAPGVLIGYEKEHIYKIITEKGKIKRCSNVKWYNNLTARPIEKKSSQRSSPSQPQPAQLQPISVPPAFLFNEIDRFLNELSLQMDDERLKLTSVFRQHAFQTARNPMIVIPRVNNSLQYIILSTPTLSAPASRGTSTSISSASGRTSQASDRNSSISDSTSFVFSANSTETLTSTFINKLTTDSTVQETRLPSASSVETKLRSAKDFSMSSLTDLAVLPNCDLAVAKAALALLAKAFSIDSHEPKTYKKAITNAQHKMNWQFNINDEMISHKDNKTWVLINETPKRRKILTDKWVYRCKRNINEKITRYKARWCVRGFEQLKSFNYHETFVSMIKPISYKTIFAIAAANNWNVEQMNVKTAFLYNYVNEKIYVKVPHDYTNPKSPRVICRLRKALYGLKQALRVWSDTLKEFLKQHNFLPLNADQSVFCDGKTIIAIYVNNLLITGPNTKTNKDIKTALSKRFQITDLGPMAHYLEMQLNKDRPQRILWLSQRAYLKKILKDHNFLNSKPMFTSMNTGTKLKAAPAGYIAKSEFKHIYQSAVDSLMYTMLETRPDIAYAVFVVNRYAFNPTKNHWTTVKRIFRYLKDTLHLRLTFSSLLRPLANWTDANWAGDNNTRRFISDYIFNLDNAAITWFSKRQPTIALSICETKYMSQTQAVKEAIWLFDLLNELDTSSMPINIDEGLIAFEIFEPVYSLVATIIYCDNQGTQALAKNFINHSRMKHMDIQHHFVREKIAEGQIQLKHVPTQNQIADGLIKPLPRNAFEKFRNALSFSWFLRPHAELSH